MCYLFMVSCCTDRRSDRQGRAARKVYGLLELLTQSKLGDTNSTEDAEEYERESKTVILAGALFALLAMLVWSLTVSV